ncbi:26S proteasome subunit rpt4, partial [Cladochytrium tenue]
MAAASDERRAKALSDYRKKLLQHREIDAKLKELRLGLRSLEKEYNKTEDDMKALQSVGQTIAEVLKQLSEER